LAPEPVLRQWRREKPSSLNKALSYLRDSGGAYGMVGNAEFRPQILFCSYFLMKEEEEK
jgi:hypothetical protein